MATKFDQDLDYLARALHLLPFRWCKVDPIEYKCKIIESKLTDFWFLFFFGHHPRLSAGPQDFIVPKQIFDVTKMLGVETDADKVKMLVTEVRRELSKLRESIVIRSGIKMKTPGSTDWSSRSPGNSFEISADNRTAYLNDKEYRLNEKEGAVIRHLYEKSKQRFQSVEKHDLIDIGCGAKSTVTDVRDIFSDRGTYKALVKNAGKGLYKLNI